MSAVEWILCHICENKTGTKSKLIIGLVVLIMGLSSCTSVELTGASLAEQKLALAEGKA